MLTRKASSTMMSTAAVDIAVDVRVCSSSSVKELLRSVMSTLAHDATDSRRASLSRADDAPNADDMSLIGDTQDADAIAVPVSELTLLTNDTSVIDDTSVTDDTSATSDTSIVYVASVDTSLAMLTLPVDMSCVGNALPTMLTLSVDTSPVMSVDASGVGDTSPAMLTLPIDASPVMSVDASGVGDAMLMLPVDECRSAMTSDRCNWSSR